MLATRTPPARPACRRGAILLIVLTLLALFAVIGLTFALYAESEATAARIHREVFDDPAPADELALLRHFDQQAANNFAMQVLFGAPPTDPAGYYSALRGHALADTKFVSQDGAAYVPNGLLVNAAGQSLGVAGNGFPVASTRARTSVFMGQGSISEQVNLQPAGIPVAIDRGQVVNYTFKPFAANPGQGVLFDPEVSGMRVVRDPATTIGQFHATGAQVDPATPATWRRYVSKAAPYTYPDVNNLYLAQVRPDTGQTVTPSYHRPWVFDTLPGGTFTSSIAGLLQQTYPGIPQADRGTLFALDQRNPNWTTELGRLKVLRPRPWDQLTQAEQARVATDPNPPFAGLPPLPYPVPEAITFNEQTVLVARINAAIQAGITPNVIPFPPQNADGTTTGDVQNYRFAAGAGGPGTQRNDSVWLYTGGQPVTWRGKTIVPLIAPMLLDLSGRANLNVAGDVFRSGQGFGPHEINLARVLYTHPTDLTAAGEVWQMLWSRQQGMPPPTGAPLPGTRNRLTQLGTPASDSPTQLAMPTDRILGPLQVDPASRRLKDAAGRPVVSAYNAGLVPPAYSSVSYAGTAAAAALLPTAGTPPAAPAYSPYFPSYLSTPPQNPPGSPPAPGQPQPDPVPAPDPTAGYPGGVYPVGYYAGQFARSQDPFTRSLLASFARYNPSQWAKNQAAGSAGTHAFGFEELRWLASRYGLSQSAARAAALNTELGRAMPLTLANTGVNYASLATLNMGTPGPGQFPVVPRPNDPPLQPGATGGRVSAENAARALLTTYSATLTRAELAVPTWAVVNNAASAVPVRLGPIDLNRTLPDFRVNPDLPLGPENVFPLVPTIAPWKNEPSNLHAYKPFCRARQARQNLARDIFVRVAAVMTFPVGTNPVPVVDGAEVCYNPTTGYLAHFNPQTKAFEPLSPPGTPQPNLTQPDPATATLRFNALRRAAQVAANIVDFIDGDDVNTTFVWNPVNPLYNDRDAADPANTGGANALNAPLAPGGGLVSPPLPPNGLPPADPPVVQFIDPSADPANFPPPRGPVASAADSAAATLELSQLGNRVVYGTELPRLAINEAYCAVVNHKSDRSGSSGNPNQNFQKQFWVELHNPLPRDADEALSAGGAAQLMYFNNPAQAFSKPTYSPYRLEIAETSLNPNPPVPGQIQGYVAQALDQTTGNVTGDLAIASLAVPAISPPAIRVSDFHNVGGNPGNPSSPTLLPTYPNPNGIAADNANYQVLPLGSGATQPNKGFFTVGPNSYEIPTPNPPAPTTTRLPDAVPPPSGLPPYPVPVNAMSIDTGKRSTNDLQPPAQNPNGALRPNAVVLRRLANPYFPANYPGMSPSESGQPDGYRPDLPYNPYVTIDVLDGLTSHTNVQRATGGNPPPADPGQSLYRRHPYAGELAAEGQLANGAPLPHTFFGPNSPLPAHPSLVGSAWLPHLDRQLVSPAELLHVSARPPYQLTTRFAVGPYPPAQGSATFTWVSNAHTLQAAFTQRDSYPNEIPRDQNQLPMNPLAYPFDTALYRALDVLTVRSQLTGLPVGGPEQGRVNVNGLWDEFLDPVQPVPTQGRPTPPTAPSNRLLRGVLDAANPASSLEAPRTFFNAQYVASLWDDPTNTTRGVKRTRTPNWPNVGPAQAGNATLPEQPFYGFGGTVWDPAAKAATGQLPDPTPTLLRPGNNLPGVPNQLQPMFFFGGAAGQPYAQAEPLRKAFNSVSTTGDAFLVIFTVGYFEVRGIDPTASNFPRPLIGREAFDRVPGDLRTQYVTVVDRSQMTIADVTAATTPGPRPWFTSLAADAAAGDNRITVTGVAHQVPGNGPAVYDAVGVIRDGQVESVPIGSRLRLGFGDAAADGNDGEWVTVGGVRPGPNPGEATLVLATPLGRNHGASSPVSNAVLGSPGPQPPLGLNLFDPSARGVVPFFEQTPR